MYTNIYIILLLLALIILNLYLVNFYYNETKIIKKIIHDWIDKTNGGHIRLDKNGSYKDDYYLSIYNFKNDDSHIHLIKNCEQSDLCYVIKKENKHSNLYIINQNKNVDDIVDEMIENYNNFD